MKDPAQTQPVKLWKTFKELWNQSVSQDRNVEDLINIWDTPALRTQHYKSKVLPSICDSMDLQLQVEHHHIDFSLASVVNSIPVPIIHVESENIGMDSPHEMQKLCLLHAPLKVLVVCVAWTDAPGFFPGATGGKIDVLPQQWQTQIKAHSSLLKQDTVYGVIIGEKSNQRQTLRYYSMAFDGCGAVLEHGTEPDLEFSLT